MGPFVVGSTLLGVAALTGLVLLIVRLVRR
ncbi:hypothetical protein SAMN05421541_12753 [Actinoplanes philippinensis]|uniref:Uncharacterized protein n=1 Tax=Actinoplanes philippinensis TaxID=35752 RepID=A0A1I2MDR1_9ACTN|nr:hypothetical protein SAMN05421541_12753 [Actinoplanes philippinensis]